MSSPRLRIKRGLSGMTVVTSPETKKALMEVTTATTTTVMAPRPGPLSKKSKVIKSDEFDNGVRPTRVQRFMREMKDSNVRNGYIEAVDNHVDKLLESVRDRRSESSGRGKRGSNFSSRKPSQAAQIAETTKRIDLSSADSILGHVKNPRVLLNPTSFASLPLFYQYKLVKLLPTCDQLIGESGWVKPSAFSLTNEFFTKACGEWCESLKEGKFNPEILTRKRMEMEREKSKLDPFKLAHFEPIWGSKLESAIDHRSEYDRIPRTVEFLISPSSFFSQTCTQQVQEDNSFLLQESMSTQSAVNQVTNGSSNDTVIDSDVYDSTQSGVESSTNHSSIPSCVDKPLKSILKKPKQFLFDDEHEVQTIEITSITPITPEGGRCSLPNSSPSQFKKQDISITPLESCPATDQDGSPSKKVRILSDDPVSIPASLNSTVLSLQEIVTFPTDVSPSKSQKSLSPSTQSCNSDQSPRRPRTPVRGKCGKNSQGVDEQRSQLICKEAVERSENNKLFHFAQNGKILPRETLANQAGNSMIGVTVCDVSSLGFITDLCDGVQLTSSVPKIFNDVEITPVSSQACEGETYQDDTPLEITVQDIRDQTELKVKPSILSNYLSREQHHRQNQCSLQSSNQFFDNLEQENQSLRYKLPDGITITPFSSPENSTSQVSVITRGSVTSRQAGCQDLVRLPSQITVIPLGMSSSDRPQPVINTPPELNRESSEGNPTIICSEAAQHTLCIVPGQPDGAEIVNTSHLCACDGKAFTPCVSCGSFCHSDCIGPSRICFNCIVNANANASYSAGTQATAVSVISAPNNPGGCPTTAYFCHI